MAKVNSIQQVISEISSTSEKDRRQSARRRGRIYRDGGKEYLIEHITNEFGKEALNEMRIAPINVMKSWVDRKSVIYARPPMRIASEGNQDLVDYYSDALAINVVMAKANRYLNLYSNSELYVIPKKFKDGRLPWINVLAPFLYSISPSAVDKTEKECLVLSDFSDDNDLTRKEIVPVGSIIESKLSKSSGDLIESNEAELSQEGNYIFWTNEQHFTVTKNGVILSDPMNPEGLNPVEKIPSITLRKEVDNEFFSSAGEDMVDIALALQLGLSDLLTIAKHQGFSLLVVTGSERPQKMEIGLNKTIWLKSQEGLPTPTMDYVQASSPLDQYTALLNRMLEIESTSNLLPAGIFSESTSSTSGEHELMKSAATLMEIESQKPVLRDAELSAWDLIKSWHNLLFDKNELPKEARALGRFSDDFSVNIIYQDMKPIESDEQRITQVERLEALGVLSKKDKFRKLFPEMTDEQIEEKVLEIDADKKSAMALFSKSIVPAPQAEQDQEEEVAGE